MTIVILALDALDAELVEHYDIDSFRLNSHGQIETFAHSQDQPYTPEVWATVATGAGPSEHGVTGGGTSRWDNPLIEFASRFTGHLDESTRGTLGRLVRDKTGEREQIAETEIDTMFDYEGAVVHNWPGVHDGRDLQAAWDLMNAVAEEMPRSAFERELLGLAAEQFGWAREMLNHEVRLAGVHVHTLDAAGHAYADDSDSLEAMYRRVAGFVDEISDAMSDEDELLILSDHGMCTSFLESDDGSRSASHSWRAYAASTTDDIPESVFDVVDWIDRHISAPGSVEEEELEMPMDRLRELGYVD